MTRHNANNPLILQAMQRIQVALYVSLSVIVWARVGDVGGLALGSARPCVVRYFKLILGARAFYA